jgi:alpha-amylase
MASICLYFQMHQPYRLRRYSVFDTEPRYFDEARTAVLCRTAAERCYLPATRLILDLVRRHKGQFRLSYSISGVLLDQLETWKPEVINLLRKLTDTGCIEWLAETYHHSLSFLYSRQEFSRQVEAHRQRIMDLFGQQPRAFRNTELMYNNDLACVLTELGFQAVLCEKVDSLLESKDSNHLYNPPYEGSLCLLVRNSRLSDAIAWRFTDRNWPDWPITADKFARWVDQAREDGPCVNLFLNYEKLSRPEWGNADILDFFAQLPAEILRRPDNDFKTPSEMIETYPALGRYDVPCTITWAEGQGGLSAWVGNAMQSNALHELYRLETDVLAGQDDGLIRDWRRLQQSDLFYVMRTQHLAEGKVYPGLDPSQSPYDSYIDFMNVLDNLRSRIEAVTGE